MKHLIAILVLLCATTLVVRAGDDVKGKKDPAGDKKAEPAKKGEIDPDDDPPVEDAKKGKEKEESPKEIIGRIGKNLQSSEDRLGKKDAGDETRQIQRDIVKDLDALIEQAKKQQEKSQGGGGGGGGQANPNQQQKPAGGQQPDNQEGADGGGEGSKSQAKGGGGAGGQPGQAKGGGEGQGSTSAGGPGGAEKGGQPQAGQTKGAGAKDERPMPGTLGGNSDEKKDEKKEGLAKGDGQKDAKPGEKQSTARAKDDNPKTRTNLTDVFREVWGHLPEMRRQEMDAYQRERFMQRYDELLRQYYRTLSEQNRKQDN